MSAAAVTRTEEIYYLVPVVVTVDLEAGEVTRAVVVDEEIRRDANYARSPSHARQQDEAYDIADAGYWPEWEFGF